MQSRKHIKEAALDYMTAAVAVVRERGPEELKAIARDDFAGLDAAKGIGGKVACLFGLEGIGKAARGAMRTSGGAFLALWHATESMVIPEPKWRLPTKATDPVERFRIAQWAYSRTDEDLERIETAAYRVFVTYYLLAVLALCWGILTVSEAMASDLPPLLKPGLPFILVPVLLARAGRASFRHWQIRTRRLGTVGEWWAERAFMPPSSTAGLLLMFGFGLVTLLPTTAHATGLLNLRAALPPEDFFGRMLQVMLPGVGPIPADTLSPYAAPLAGAFSAFNAALLQAGAAMLTYHTVAGTVSTARDGQVLGTRWNEVWAPIRVTTGVASVAPMSSGYCLAQVIILHVLLVGSNLANSVWAGYLDLFTPPAVTAAAPSTTDSAPSAVVQNPIPLLMPLMKIQSRELVRAFGAKEICWLTIAHHRALVGGATIKTGYFFWSSETPAIGEWPVAQPAADGEAYVWNYGPVCGQVTMASSETMTQMGEHSGLKAAVKRWFPDTVDAQIARTRKDFLKSLVGDIDQARLTLKGFAQDWVTLTPAVTVGGGRVVLDASKLDGRIRETIDGFTAAWRNREAEYDTFVRTIGATLAGNSVANAKKAGWAAAGAYYMTLSRLQESLLDMVSFQPTVSPISIDGLVGTELLTKLVGDLRTRTPGTVGGFQAYWASMDNSFHLAASDTEAGGNDDLIESLVNGAVLGTLRGALWVESLNPMTALNDIVNHGHKMIVASYVSFGAYALAQDKIEKLAKAAQVAETVTAVVPVPGVSTAVSAAASTLVKLGPWILFVWNMVNWALLGAGAMLAFVLPLSAYFMFLMGVVGMVIVAVEALVAAPLFAMWHVRLDGAEFHDGLGQGYMIVFTTVLLRQTLLLFGLFLSYGVFGASIWLVNETFYPAVAGMLTGHLAGPVAFLVALIAFGYIQWTLAMKSFSLISEVPSRVLRWIGSGPDHLGEHEETQKSTNFLGGHVSNKFDRFGSMVPNANPKAPQENGGPMGLTKPTPDNKLK